MTTISPRAMELDIESNERIPCSAIPQINLERWKINDIRQGLMFCFISQTSAQVKLISSLIQVTAYS